MQLNALKKDNHDSRKSLDSRHNSIKGFGANRSTYGSVSDKENSLIDLHSQPGIRLLKYI